ncbi:MAG: hypothetical protein IJI68_04050 [Eggerthellaceae bacterium]|nr:hypothetical protein [Eggerthellaceae bacterium]
MPVIRRRIDYASYFHGDEGLLEIQADSGKGSLLIVGDSYTNCIDYLFANQYRHVYVIDPRYYTETIDSFMQDHEVDDAVMIMGSNTVVSDKTAAFLKSEKS